MSGLLQDLRHALRRLRRSPAYSLTILLTLGVGLGGLVTAFGLLYGIALRPLPYPDAERLVMVHQTLPGWDRFPASWPAYRAWRDGSRSFESLAAYDDLQVTVEGADGPRLAAAAPATANLFGVLGVEPELGRTFSAREAARGEPVAVLGHGFWKRHFGGDPGALGRTLRVDGEPHTVIGVMPAGLDFPAPENELWLPLGPEAREAGWDSQFLRVLGRLRDGVSPTAARVDVEEVTARFVAANPGSPEVGARVVPRREDLAGPMRPTLLVFLAAGGLVLAIAAANVVNLFLARTVGRMRELALRKALGADRGALARGLVVECLALSGGGAVLGAILAGLALGPVKRLLPPGTPRLEAVAIDLPVLAFGAAAAVLVGLALGLGAAVRAERLSPARALPRGHPGTDPPRSGRLRSGLVVVQVAIAFVVLVGAGLLVNSFLRLNAVETGFEPDRVLAALELGLPEERYESPARRSAFVDGVLERLRGRPGVASAAAVVPLPFSGSRESRSFVAEGRPDPTGDGTEVPWTAVTPAYFETMGIPLVRGRSFREGETERGRPVVVSEALASRLWPDGDAVGARLRLGGNTAWSTVVGVVGDVRHGGLRSSPEPKVYQPLTPAAASEISFVVRSEGHPRSVAATLREAIREGDPRLPLPALAGLDDLVDRSLADDRLSTMLMAAFAVIAVLLSGIGLYGLLSFAIAHRRHELGVRLALGARPADLVLRVLGYGAVRLALGLALGIPAALALSRVLASELYGVGTTDVPTYIAVALFVAGVCLWACWGPARRAARTDPVMALRAD